MPHFYSMDEVAAMFNPGSFTMDDGGRCLLDVINDPLLLQSFLEGKSTSADDHHASGAPNATSEGRLSSAAADEIGISSSSSSIFGTEGGVAGSAAGGIIASSDGSAAFAAEFGVQTSNSGGVYSLENFLFGSHNQASGANNNNPSATIGSTATGSCVFAAARSTSMQQHHHHHQSMQNNNSASRSSSSANSHSSASVVANSASSTAGNNLQHNLPSLNLQHHSSLESLISTSSSPSNVSYRSSAPPSSITVQQPHHQQHIVTSSVASNTSASSTLSSAVSTKSHHSASTAIYRISGSNSAATPVFPRSAPPPAPPLFSAASSASTTTSSKSAPIPISRSQSSNNSFSRSSSGTFSSSGATTTIIGSTNTGSVPGLMSNSSNSSSGTTSTRIQPGVTVVRGISHLKSQQQSKTIMVTAASSSTGGNNSTSTARSGGGSSGSNKISRIVHRTNSSPSPSQSPRPASEPQASVASSTCSSSTPSTPTPGLVVSSGSLAGTPSPTVTPAALPSLSPQPQIIIGQQGLFPGATPGTFYLNQCIPGLGQQPFFIQTGNQFQLIRAPQVITQPTLATSGPQSTGKHPTAAPLIVQPSAAAAGRQNYILAAPRMLTPTAGALQFAVTPSGQHVVLPQVIPQLGAFGGPNDLLQAALQPQIIAASAAVPTATPTQPSEQNRTPTPAAQPSSSSSPVIISSNGGGNSSNNSSSNPSPHSSTNNNSSSKPKTKVAVNLGDLLKEHGIMPETTPPPSPSPSHLPSTPEAPSSSMPSPPSPRNDASPASSISTTTPTTTSSNPQLKLSLAQDGSIILRQPSPPKSKKSTLNIITSSGNNNNFSNNTHSTTVTVSASNNTTLLERLSTAPVVSVPDLNALQQRGGKNVAPQTVSLPSHMIAAAPTAGQVITAGPGGVFHINNGSVIGANGLYQTMLLPQAANAGTTVLMRTGPNGTQQFFTVPNGAQIVSPFTLGSAQGSRVVYLSNTQGAAAGAPRLVTLSNASPVNPTAVSGSGTATVIKAPPAQSPSLSSSTPSPSQQPPMTSGVAAVSSQSVVHGGGATVVSTISSSSSSLVSTTTSCPSSVPSSSSSATSSVVSQSSAASAIASNASSVSSFGVTRAAAAAAAHAQIVHMNNQNQQLYQRLQTQMAELAAIKNPNPQQTILLQQMIALQEKMKVNVIPEANSGTGTSGVISATTPVVVVTISPSSSGIVTTSATVTSGAKSRTTTSSLRAIAPAPPPCTLSTGSSVLSTCFVEASTATKPSALRSISATNTKIYDNDSSLYSASIAARSAQLVSSILAASGVTPSGGSGINNGGGAHKAKSSHGYSGSSSSSGHNQQGNSGKVSSTSSNATKKCDSSSIVGGSTVHRLSPPLQQCSSNSNSGTSNPSIILAGCAGNRGTSSISFMDAGVSSSTPGYASPLTAAGFLTQPLTASVTASNINNGNSISNNNNNGNSAGCIGSLYSTGLQQPTVIGAALTGGSCGSLAALPSSATATFYANPTLGSDITNSFFHIPNPVSQSSLSSANAAASFFTSGTGTGSSLLSCLSEVNSNKNGNSNTATGGNVNLSRQQSHLLADSTSSTAISGLVSGLCSGSSSSTFRHAATTLSATATELQLADLAAVLAADQQQSISQKQSSSSSSSRTVNSSVGNTTRLPNASSTVTRPPVLIRMAQSKTPIRVEVPMSSIKDSSSSSSAGNTVNNSKQHSPKKRASGVNSNNSSSTTVVSSACNTVVYTSSCGNTVLSSSVSPGNTGSTITVRTADSATATFAPGSRLVKIEPQTATTGCTTAAGFKIEPAGTFKVEPDNHQFIQIPVSTGSNQPVVMTTLSGGFVSKPTVVLHYGNATGNVGSNLAGGQATIRHRIIGSAVVSVPSSNNGSQVLTSAGVTTRPVVVASGGTSSPPLIGVPTNLLRPGAPAPTFLAGNLIVAAASSGGATMPTTTIVTSSTGGATIISTSSSQNTTARQLVTVKRKAAAAAVVAHVVREMNNNSSSGANTHSNNNCDSKVALQIGISPKSLVDPILKRHQFHQRLQDDQAAALAPDTRTPFNDKNDILSRLLPYHVFDQVTPDDKDFKTCDDVFESVAEKLLTAKEFLKRRFQWALLQDSARGQPSGENVLVERLLLEDEKEALEEERIRQEERQEQQAAIAQLQCAVANSPPSSLSHHYSPPSPMSCNNMCSPSPLLNNPSGTTLSDSPAALSNKSGGSAANSPIAIHTGNHHQQSSSALQHHQQPSSPTHQSSTATNMFHHGVAGSGILSPSSGMLVSPTAGCYGNVHHSSASTVSPYAMANNSSGSPSCVSSNVFCAGSTLGSYTTSALDAIFGADATSDVDIVISPKRAKLSVNCSSNNIYGSGAVGGGHSTRSGSATAGADIAEATSTAEALLMNGYHDDNSSHPDDDQVKSALSLLDALTAHPGHHSTGGGDNEFSSGDPVLDEAVRSILLRQ